MSYIDCNKCDNGYIDCRPCEGRGTLECRTCEGDGYLICRSCDGRGYYADSGRPCKRCGTSGKVECRRCSRTGRVTCFKCNGSGKLTCLKCSGSGRVESPWDTKKCEWSSGCNFDISVHRDWSNPPKFCPKHYEELRRIKAEREAAQAKWHKKSCDCCGDEITWHEDNREPKYCKKCNTEVTKSCAAQITSGHHDEIRYKKFYTNVPIYCGRCKSGQNRIEFKERRSDGDWDQFEGYGYLTVEGRPVFIDDHGKHSHVVLNADGSQKGHREEGWSREWTKDDEREAQCVKCGKTFSYPVKLNKTPPFCNNCYEEWKHERDTRAGEVRFSKHHHGRVDEYHGISHDGTSQGIFSSGHPHSHTVRKDKEVVYHRDQDENVVIDTDE